jgi:hypothetical protein
MVPPMVAILGPHSQLATLNSTGITNYTTASYTDVRARCSAYTYGSVSVTLNQNAQGISSQVTFGGASGTVSLANNGSAPPHGERLSAFV